MAVTMMLGPPGAGKSYEATVFQVLPALREGRMVITNLPLNVEEFEKLDEDFPGLIEVVQPTKENPRPFSRVEDYKSEWRHPETGVGPLFVIDECHFALPRGKTDIAVEEWYSLHRHEGVDLILMTQSYGKVSKAVCDIVQTAIVLRKNTNLGSRQSYRRDVRDGLTRANSLGVVVRRYKRQYFPLYQSYTRGGKGEAGVSDVLPLWRRWQFYGLGLIALYLVYEFLFGSGFNLFGSVGKALPEKSPVAAAGTSPKAGTPAGGPGQPVGGGRAGEIGALREMVEVGYLTVGPERVAIFRAIKGPSKVVMTANQLARQGYFVSVVGPCLYRVQHRDKTAEVGCE